MKTTLAIFGITGDLSRRKLLPALANIIKSGEAGELEVVGISRRDIDIRSLLESAIGDDEHKDLFRTFTMDLASADDYVRLKESIQPGVDEQLLVYLSVPPSAATTIVDFLGSVGLNGDNVKLLFEKPFGFDLVSARDFIERTGRYFVEEQIYRIDHYMAKEISQEIIRLRRHEGWSHKTVKSIDVVATESIDIEGRADFYEETGALRDFLQGHLMQVLALSIMEIPTDFSMKKLPDYRLKALEKLRPVDPTQAYRAQYEGYQDEVENVGSLTETFAAVTLYSDDESLQGVPLRLITGKALNEKRSYVEVTCADGSTFIVEEGKVQPSRTTLMGAYERVLMQSIRGVDELFTTSPEVLRSWEILAPVQIAWGLDNAPLPLYKKGSSAESVLG